MRKDLAHVSQKPGKTQTINFFTVFTDKCKDPKLAQGTWWLVDLPGYGYAKVSKTQRVGMERMIRDYVVLRENLQCVFCAY
jgi:GTP-binding protein